jgi:hypothetical protein
VVIILRERLRQRIRGEVPGDWQANDDERLEDKKSRIPIPVQQRSDPYDNPTEDVARGRLAGGTGKKVVLQNVRIGVPHEKRAHVDGRPFVRGRRIRDPQKEAEQTEYDGGEQRRARTH